MSEGKRYDLGPDESVKRCDTCIYFGTVVEVYDQDAMEEVETKFHRCDRIDILTVNDTNSLALIDDGNDEFATLVVDKDFGCVLWRQK